MAGAILVFVLGLVIGNPIPSFTQSSVPESSKSCPMVLDSRLGITTEVVKVVFVDEVVGSEGNMMKIPDRLKPHIRLAIATIKIVKPPGLRLTLPAADLTLHYYAGAQSQKAETMPCEGLSEFTTALESERPINLNSGGGPGFLKQSTRTKSTRAGVLYMDAVFCYIEPAIKECWVCVAHPTTTQPFITQGWER